MPGPFLARNRPTGVSGPSGASSSTWFSPRSSSTASTPCSCTISRWASSISKRSRYSSSEGSICSTATPMWSMRVNTPRSLFVSEHVRRGGGGDHAQADAGRALHARDAGHDPLDSLALQHLVLEQLVRQRVELAAVGDDQPLRGAARLL